jgi:NAD+ kinase
MAELKIGCTADERSEVAQQAKVELMTKYGVLDLDKHKAKGCDYIIAIGGDGTMLRTLHKFMDSGIPVFGMNRGSVGFLLNQYHPDNLEKRLKTSVKTHLYPLEMTVHDEKGGVHKALAINEVSLLRQHNQAAKLQISINNNVRMPELFADGVLVSTPAGSTAYNFAAYGPIIPLSANLLALTPISPFRPRRWRGALLAHNSKVTFNILESEKRPVSAVADSQEFRNVKSVEVEERRDLALTLLFDKDNLLEDRVIKEQFSD